MPNNSKKSFVVAGSEDGHVFLWDLPGQTVAQKLPAHADVVLAVASHPTEQLIATGSLDTVINLYRDKLAAPSAAAASAASAAGASSASPPSAAAASTAPTPAPAAAPVPPQPGASAAESSASKMDTSS
jgi:WD40 repeat protein